jgi:predicted porin
MKKSLIALAVLGSVAGVAQAQSSVTLYGIADVWVGRVSETDAFGAKDSATLMESGGLNGSRWGLKGSEDLGGGLKAVFKLEQGFKIDTGTSAGGFNRQAYVGLEGGFGSVTFGNTWTAMDDVLGASNSGFDSALSASNSVLAVQALYASNPGNTIKYTSPSFGGISAGFSHSLDEVSGVKADVTDFSLSYAAGPVAANFAYQLQNDVTDLKLTALNGSYDLGAAKLLASYGQAKAGALKATDYQFGVDVPMSAAMTVSAGYAHSKDNAAAGGEKRTGYGVAVGYSLSKRTTTYAGFRQAKVKDSSEKDRVIAVGVRHTF